MRSPGLLRTGSGFTLAEFLVAMSVLLIIMVAAIPLFVYIAEAAQANKVRLEATRIAGSEIERIRALPYSQVGNIGGNPPGAIPQERTIALNGVNYTVTTDVWWWDDLSDAVGGAGAGRDPIPYDYKRVKVSVSAPGLFTGKVTMYLDLDTLATLEGEEEAFPGGNIRLRAQRGWKQGTDEVPVEGARVRLTAGPDAPQTLWTDNFGRSLFAILAAGDYTVSFTAPAGMIARPDQLSLDAEVTTGVTAELIAEAEFPVRIALSLRDIETKAPLVTSGTVTLVRPYGGDQNFAFTSDAGGLIGDIFGDLWPVGGAPFGHPGIYSLRIHGDGYMTYDMAVVQDPEKPRLPTNDAWDGTFVAPNTRLDLTVYLRPIFYREPRPVPFQPAAHFENLTVTGDELILSSTVATHDFRLSPLYAARAAAGQSTYRGYRFRVDTALTVTHLIGGGNRSGFAGAIYRADPASPNRPVALLGSVDFTGDTRQQEVPLARPVLLLPGTDYILAQGRASGRGAHHRVSRINVGLINSDTPLSGWFPADGNALHWDRTGAPTAILNRDPAPISDSHRPDLGFRYQSAVFRPVGSKISLPIDLSAFTAAPVLRVHWEALTPAGTSIAVATAVTASTATPESGDFTAVTNGGAIPDITADENLEDHYLWLRVTLSSADRAQTPRLHWLSVEY